MIWKTPNGRDREVSYVPYLVDWDAVVSGPQKKVKDFLRPYWAGKTVLEEFRIPGTKLRVDLICLNDSVAIEVDGCQHDAYSEWAHGSIAGYRAAIKRDLDKAKALEANGFTVVTIKQKELPLLTHAWVATTFGVVL